MKSSHLLLTCAVGAESSTVASVCDRETIDSELRLLAAVRGTAAELGGPLPSIRLADELLDERAATAKGLKPRPY